MIDKAIIGSIMCGGEEITLYMARPSVIECATVKAVACHKMVFNFGLNKKRLSIKRMWSNPRGMICVKPNCR